MCLADGGLACDHCEEAWFPDGFYWVFNLSLNVFMMLVIKHGSATLLFLVSTLGLPLTSLAFSSSLAMGAQAQPLRFGL